MISEKWFIMLASTVLVQSVLALLIMKGETRLRSSVIADRIPLGECSRINAMREKLNWNCGGVYIKRDRMKKWTELHKGKL